MTQEVRKRIKSECPPFNLEGFNPCYLLFCLSFDALKKGVEISTAYSTAREARRDQGAGEGSMVVLLTMRVTTISLFTEYFKGIETYCLRTRS